MSSSPALTRPADTSPDRKTSTTTKKPPAPPNTLDPQAQALLLVSADFAEFLKFVHIVDVETKAIVRYKRWRHLMRVARALQERRSVIILKARQLGITWIVAAYALWSAMFAPYTVILVISKDQEAAKDVVKKAATIYRFLPPWLRQPYTKLTTPSTGNAIMEFGNGSSITSQAATENAGRGITASVVIVDEAAFHPFAATNYAAYVPALGMHGQLIMVSTSNGPHGLFHALYQDARKRLNDYTPIFIPWWARPDRQEPLRNADGLIELDELGRPRVVGPSKSWLSRMRGRFRGTPANFRHEYPNTEGEAWSLQSGLVYGLDDDGEAIFEAREHPRGNLSPDPVPLDDCPMVFAGIDWGGGDPSVCDIWGLTPSGRLHQYAELHMTGPVDIQAFAEFLADWQPENGYESVECGAEEGTSIETLKSLGFPARRAMTKRDEGIGTCKLWLKGRRITHNPETCPHAIAEYDGYYWATKRNQVTKETYATRTTVGQHADHKDAMRYVVVAVQELEDQEYGDLPPYDVQES